MVALNSTSGSCDLINKGICNINYESGKLRFIDCTSDGMNDALEQEQMSAYSDIAEKVSESRRKPYIDLGYKYYREVVNRPNSSNLFPAVGIDGELVRLITEIREKEPSYGDSLYLATSEIVKKRRYPSSEICMRTFAHSDAFSVKYCYKTFSGRWMDVTFVKSTTECRLVSTLYSIGDNWKNCSILNNPSFQVFTEIPHPRYPFAYPQYRHNDVVEVCVVLMDYSEVYFR